jgi:hypothetical protein
MRMAIDSFTCLADLACTDRDRIYKQETGSWVSPHQCSQKQREVTLGLVLVMYLLQPWSKRSW